MRKTEKIYSYLHYINKIFQNVLSKHKISRKMNIAYENPLLIKLLTWAPQKRAPYILRVSQCSSYLLSKLNSIVS
jgi:hypothetical protein